MLNKIKRNLLCVLVDFPVAFLQFVLPLFFIVFKVFNFGLISVVSIDYITVGRTFVVYDGSAFHILIIIVHIYVSLRVSYPRRFHAFVHLTRGKKVLHICTGNNSILKCFVHALTLNETQSFVFVGMIRKISESINFRGISKTLSKSN